LTTISAQLDPDLARRVAKAADILKLTHEQVATEAVRLFVRSVTPDISPRKPRKRRRLA
jgi:predicted transcriptional regulator